LYFKIGIECYRKQKRVYSAYNTETPTPGYVLYNAGAGADIINKKGNVILSINILGNNITDLAIEMATGRLYIGTTTGFSIFDSGVLPPTADLADMKAFPNPAILADGVQFVEFKRVPSIGTLSIYTTSGDLVRRLDLSQQNTWDLMNSNGERVAGGIYFFHVRSGSASGTGKIAIIK